MSDTGNLVGGISIVLNNDIGERAYLYIPIAGWQTTLFFGISTVTFKIIKNTTAFNILNLSLLYAICWLGGGAN